MKGSKSVNSGIDTYNSLHHNESVSARVSEYSTLVNTYYDLVTIFYEWGWCESFHFAYRFANETFYEAIRRHEYELASKLGINRPDMKVLDVGCGIGGPLRNIGRFSKADITGVTLNQYQVHRGNELCQRDPVIAGKCRLVHGDFMSLPFSDGQFDAAYAIDATCHAPDRLGVFREVFRALKPGSTFACYEWCMTDLYEKGNPDHERVKKLIEEGNGLPDVVHSKVCINAMKEAGFSVVEARDLANDNFGHNGSPWYLPVTPSWNPFSQRFQFNWFGYWLVNLAVQVLEFLWLAPKGSYKTQKMLQRGARGLGQGGKLKIFSAMFLIVGKVPEGQPST